jgi:thioredoxin-like negative regulator of GroEL
MALPLITSINDRAHFAELLQSNPGVFIVKFGAEWCGPCKIIEEYVHKCFSQMPNNVQCAIVDIDESFDIYAFLKSKRMVNGIPAILAYYKGNLNYVPNLVIAGTNLQQIQTMFNTCVQTANTIVQ